MRTKAIKYLTQFLLKDTPTSFLRLGDGELRFLLYRTPLQTGLSTSHYERLVAAYENCGYLDLCMNQAENKEMVKHLNLHLSPSTYVNNSPETGNIIRDWTYYEFHDYISGRRCLIAGAEAALLRELYSTPKYRALAGKFWPEWSCVFFLQVRDNGNNLDRNLDLIKADIIEIVALNNIDTIFLSLGGTAKILCHEITEELGVTTIDWGSLIRALAYSGSRGDSQKRDYCPYFLRVPFDIWMRALESAHSKFGIATLLAKAHAQLQLELNRRKPKVGAFVFDPSPDNLKDFYENLEIYKKHWRPRASGEKEAQRLILYFELWRTLNGLNTIGRLLRPLLSALKPVVKTTKAFLRRAKRILLLFHSTKIM